MTPALPDPRPEPDWTRVLDLVLTSRALDDLEERTLLPARRMFYQFSARGHDMAQVLLGLHLTHPGDAAAGYYRSRPLLLSIGVSPEEALAASLMKQGGYSDGRDIGTVFNHANPTGCTAIPMCGGVGTQYTPAAGWAQALVYRHKTLGEAAAGRAIAVALGGDGSVATNGFWSALTMATTLSLPMLFFIEDNGFGISVPSSLQTPGGDIAANLASFGGLRVTSGDGTDPAEAARLIADAVGYVRDERAPALLRLTVPRLAGHSYQDTQAYKADAVVEAERARDPLPQLRAYLVPARMREAEWATAEASARARVADALAAAEARADPDPGAIGDHRFASAIPSATAPRAMGGAPPPGSGDPRPRAEGQRINMGAAIRRTFDAELAANPRLLLFGEDIGPKGGVHGVTLGLQDKHGRARVFDTSLSEEGIVGRAVGMALAGLMPAPEIQFRKYADPAAEQIADAGTLRWRTGGRFQCPMLLRMPGGYLRAGDPWHSQMDEVRFVHSPGWRVVMPSNAEDAVGLLRTALRGADPVLFFEHRALLDAASARRPYPGDDYALPFGCARVTMPGERVTLVTWGAMVERCEAAGKDRGGEVIDLRTLAPWDRETVLASVRRTRRCLVVHEDLVTAGFGAEVAAVVAEELFLDLDAPVARLGMPDVPPPHAPHLLDAVVPSVADIAAKIDWLAEF